MNHLSCGTVGFLQWLDAGLAFAAAVFWFFASVAKLPPPVLTWDTIDHVIPALQRQSRLNAVAAVLAALAAVLQAFLTVQPTCVTLT